MNGSIFPYFGVDAIGLLHRKFPVNNLVKSLPAGSALGTLIDTSFGDSLTNLVAVLNSGKVSVLLVDLLNNTAVRNKKLYPTELLNGYTLEKINNEAKNYSSNLYKLLEKQLNKVAPLTASNLTILVSGLLEHNLDRDSAHNVSDWIYQQGYQVIDSPMVWSYSPLFGPLGEEHGNTPSNKDIISNDGADASDANLFDDGYLSTNAKYKLLWKYSLNGNHSGMNEFVPPRKREFFTTRAEFKWMRYIIDHPIGDKPIIDHTLIENPSKIDGARTLRDRELWKLEAEDYKNGDVRGGKPMFICKSKVSRINILNINTGKNIGFLKYFDVYDADPGYFRYYLGTGSGGHCLDLLDNSDGEYILLTDKKTKWIVNAVRRCGYYRG